MKRALMFAFMFVVLAFGGPAVALDLGEKVGPVWVRPGAVICDTAEQAEQAINTPTSRPAGCGRLTGASPAFIEAISEHEFGDATYMILKITFLPPTTLGVQYGWVLGSDAATKPIGLGV